jgi:predicted nucleic acid-binding protein
VTGLLDTVVLVDLLRGHPPAAAWLSEQQRIGISPVVWLEIIEGAENSQTQARAIELLRRFDRVDVQPQDFDWAIRQALQFRLSHNVGMMDCLIAATAHRLKVPLFTRNLKHFQPMLGGLARRPY